MTQTDRYIIGRFLTLIMRCCLIIMARNMIVPNEMARELMEDYRFFAQEAVKPWMGDKA